MWLFSWVSSRNQSMIGHIVLTNSDFYRGKNQFFLSVTNAFLTLSWGILLKVADKGRGHKQHSGL